MADPVLETVDRVLYSKDELVAKFGWEEYVIFGLMLGVSASIGVFFAWKGQKNNAEFLYGGKSMGTLPMAMSLFASFMSAITLLGTPAETYLNGTMYCVLVFCYPLTMAASAYIYMPVFYKLNVSTSYEYLEWRFARPVRILASACFTLQMTLYMAIVVYTPALALSQITDFDVDLICAVVFLVCIFYTSIGGIKAVMWTDTFQTLVMFGSYLAIVIKGNNDSGGATTVYDRSYQTGRIELFNFDLDMTTRHTVWNLIIGGYFVWLTLYGINQTQVQRYLSVRKQSDIRRAIWWNMFGVIALLLMCAYAGMVIFAYYDTSGCDPVRAKLVDKTDQLLPLFVMQVMGDIPCVPGLFVAGVFSGALSTVSSGLNSLAAVTLQDFIQAACNVEISEKSKIWTTKGLAVGYGVLSYGVVFLVKYFPAVLEAALGLYGIVGGPVLGVFTLGMFNPWANAIGAFTGTMTALIFTMWIGFGQTAAKNFGTYKITPLPTRVDGCPAGWVNETTTATSGLLPEEDETDFNHLALYNISYMWFSTIAVMTCFTVGSIVSFLTRPQDPKKLNPDLISEILPKLFGGCWPKAVKKYIYSLDIGSEYVPSEREKDLRARQIMGEEMHCNKDMENGKPTLTGNKNPAFEMSEPS